MTPRKRTLIRIAGGVLSVVLILGIWSSFHQLKASKRDVPTVRVQRGNLTLNVYTTGSLRAVRSGIIMAPPVSGSLQIVHLAATGSAVKSGEVIVEFDPTEQQFKLEQARFDLQQANQEILKNKADAAVQEAQDKVALLKARFDVRRAELDVSRNELLSAIDGQKNNLTLEEAKRRLAQLEQDVRSRQLSSQASMAVAQEKRNKAQLEMTQAQRAIEQMTIRSPLNGVVALKENMDAMGGMMFSGMILPEYREGDTVRPGRPVLEVFDSSQMEIQAKINESDRANISPGQSATVRVDSIPNASYPGKVKTVASVTSRGMWWDGAMGKFDASFEITSPDNRLRPGASAQVVIASKQLQNVLFIPRQAQFERDGKPVVYVQNGSGLEAKPVKILSRGESQVAIEGVDEGTEVALVNPDQQQKQAAKKNAPAPGVARGGR